MPPPLPAGPAPEAPAPRRWPLRLGLLALGLAALITALPWVLQAVLLDQLPKQLAQVLGRPVALQDVQVGLWQREVRLSGLQIGPAPASNAAAATAPPLLLLPQLRVQLSLQSLRHGAPVIEALQAEGLQINLARTAAGHYDIDDLLARFARPSDPPPKADDAPARFAVYNLAITQARIRLDDRPAGRTHQITDLSLGLPFLSNLPAHLAVRTEPRLAFTVNGTRFDSGAAALPFAQQRQGELHLAFHQLDLAPWLGYLPADLPLQVQSARASSDLRLRFALPPQGAAQVSVLGQVQLDQVALAQAPAGAGKPSAQPLLRWKALTLALDDVQPLARQLKFGALALEGAEVFLARDARGQLLLPQAGTAAQAPSGSGTANAATPAASAAPAGAGATPPAWQFSLARLALQGATVHWSDASTQPAASLQLADVSVQASDLHWPAVRPMQVKAEAHLLAPGLAQPAAGALRIDGQMQPQAAGIEVQVDTLALGALRPYLAAALPAPLTGSLGLRGRLDWSDGSSTPARLGLTLAEARLSDLQLRAPHPPVAGKRQAPADAGPAASLQSLLLTGAQADLLNHRVSIASLTLQRPWLALARDAQGQLDALGWLAAAPAPAPHPTATAGKAAGPAWQLQLNDLRWQDGRVQWSDAVPAQAVQLRLDQLRGQLQGLAWPPTASASTIPPMRLQVAARLNRGSASSRIEPVRPATGEANKPASGQIDWQGRIGLAPLQADGRLTLHRLPLHWLMPYADAAMPVLLQRADVGFQGQVQARQTPAQQWTAALRGDLQVNEVLVQARPAAAAALPAAPAPLPLGGSTDAPSADLLSWQSLSLAGVQASLPAQGRPRLEVAQIDLRDFYSRLVITEQGRFNLQDVAVAVPAAGAASSPAASNAEASSSAASGPAGPATAANNPGLPIDLVLGATALHNGRVDFSDRFVRPNYSAKLTDLNGSIGTLRSGSREMAPISLRGRAADTAALDISGRVNPTAQPLALDIRARATDLELAPLSPYAGKYAGYAIERGKLSIDVAYKVGDDGRLEASNQVILNQLTFGERVESPSATQLPVLLAVALLKDRNGVIDINLPVSGSVSDPQFSVGGIVWKLIINLLGKALTAPFALLSGGGSDDLSLLEFLPGTAQLADAATQNLSRVAQALQDRPALTLTVAGVADLASEREALQRTQLDERLVAHHQLLQLRNAPPPGATAAPAPAAASQPAASASAPTSARSTRPTALTDAQRLQALTSLYRQTPLPDKPRNALGQLQDLPAADMQARLLAQTPVSDDAARDLALRRGLAVRDALAARGLPTDRLFLAAPKLRGPGEGAGWTPRVELKLSPR